MLRLWPVWRGPRPGEHNVRESVCGSYVPAAIGRGGLRPSVSLTVIRAMRRVRPAPLQAVLAKILGLGRRVARGPLDLRFEVDPLSELGFALLTDGCYEPQMTRLVETVISPADVFLDVGANEGYFSLVAARLGARVLAVEPQPNVVGALRRNMELNRVTGVNVHAVAAGAADGLAVLHVPTSILSGAASIVRRPRFGGRRQTVRVRRLDDVMTESGVGRLRLLKIDCEGAEGAVIIGAAQLLAAHRVDVLALEYHPEMIGEKAMSEIHGHLLGWGYGLFDNHGQTVYAAPAGVQAVTRWQRASMATAHSAQVTG